MTNPEMTTPAMTTAEAPRRPTGWAAWVVFGGMILVWVGTVHLCIGALAVFRPEVLAGGRGEAVPLSLTALAWLHLLLGALAVLTGLGLIRGLSWARVTAIALGCLAAVVDFVFAAQHPIWSVIALALTGVMLYAVAVHGGDVAGGRATGGDVAGREAAGGEAASAAHPQ